MSDYITKVTLDLDGEVEDNFKSVEEKEIETGKAVELANKTGFAEITPRYGLSIEYVIPKTGERNWSKFVIADAVVTIYRSGGSKVTYRGVRLIKKGSAKADGKEEMGYTVEFTAADRDPKV